MNMTFQKEENYLVLCNYSGDDNVIYIPSEQAVDGELLPVRVIGESVFKDCTAECIVLPMTIQEIRSHAFAYCHAKCIGIAQHESHSVFPPKLTRTEDAAFIGAQHLRDVTFTSSEIEIGDLCFSESNIQSIIFHSASKIRLGKSAFARSQLEVLIAPVVDELFIPDRCFAECHDLHLLRVDSGVINGIGAESFLNCKELEKLPAKTPLDYVGIKSLSGCSAHPAGFLRTLRDYYVAYDAEYIADIVLDIMAPHRKWLSTDFIQDKVEWIQHAVFEILKQIQNIRPTPSELALLRCTAAQYYSMNDGSDWVDYFSLYKKDDILHKFRRIIDWELTKQWEVAEQVHPPFKTLDALPDEEILRLLGYENTPKALAWTWELTKLVNAELVGDAFLFVEQTAVDFLIKVVEYKLGIQKKHVVYDISNEEVEQYYFPESEFFTRSEIFHCLRHALLFNRLCIYDDLKRAYFHLASK